MRLTSEGINQTHAIQNPLATGPAAVSMQALAPVRLKLILSNPANPPHVRRPVTIAEIRQGA